MNPFRYPDSLHLRTQTPDRFSDYRRYKPFLREEFGRRCVYCCLPDGPKGEDTFGVDHYRPRFRFPELECEYTNLFYACNICNRRKGAFWPDEGQQSLGKFIPNPCAVTMSQHLQYEGARVIALTPAGQLAQEVLDLNDARDVLYREFVLRNIEHCLREQRPLKGTSSRIHPAPFLALAFMPGRRGSRGPPFQTPSQRLSRKR